MRRLRRMCAGIMAAVMVMSMTPSVPSYASEADSIAGNTEAISGTMFDAGIDDAEDAGGGTNAETQDEDVDAAIGGLKKAQQRKHRLRILTRNQWCHRRKAMLRKHSRRM